MRRPSLAHFPVRPAQRVEQCIVGGIPGGTFPADTPLPSERRLAPTIGVARPLLRETLHRLANEGWLTIAHGKPARTNDLWEQAGSSMPSSTTWSPAPPFSFGGMGRKTPLPIGRIEVD